MYRRNKYRNRTVNWNGEIFDSAKEWKRYLDLEILVENGLITNLQRQVKFELIPTQRTSDGTVERSVSYIADFVYERDGQMVVEDTKGYRTKEYVIKRKLMLYLKGIQIVEI